MKKLLKKLGYYNKTQTLLAFEYGMYLQEIIKKEKIVLDIEKWNKIEDILIDEMNHMSTDEFAMKMVPLILATIEQIKLIK